MQGGAVFSELFAAVTSSDGSIRAKCEEFRSIARLHAAICIVTVTIYRGDKRRDEEQDAKAIWN